MSRLPHALLATLSALLLVAVGQPAPAQARSTVRELFTFLDAAIVESSGLVRRGDLAFTVNDKGDRGRVFAVDVATGETVGVTRWSPAPVDVEALAPGPTGQVWVGDLGDNDASRTSVRAALVPVGRGTRRISPVWYRLRYPDGAQDAEALLRHPGNGRLVVVTKSADSGTVQVAPRRLVTGAVNLTAPRSRGVIRMVTDGAFFPDARHFIVRNYTKAAVYTWPGVEEVGVFTLPEQRQGEGLAVRSYRTILLSSEGETQPVLAVTLPAEITDAITPPSPKSNGTPAWARRRDEGAASAHHGGLALGATLYACRHAM